MSADACTGRVIIRAAVVERAGNTSYSCPLRTICVIRVAKFEIEF